MGSRTELPVFWHTPPVTPGLLLGAIHGEMLGAMDAIAGGVETA